MDAATAKGFILVPTLGRVTTLLPRLLESLADTGTTTPVVLAVQRADYEANRQAYEDLAVKHGCGVSISETGPTNTQVAMALNAWFKSDSDFVIWLADDCVAETPRWDHRLIDQLTGYNIVTCNDGLNAPRRANGAMAYSGDLVRTLGGLYPGACRHFFIDDMIETLGTALPGVWTCDMDVMVRHLHHSRGGTRDATTDRTEPLMDADERAFTAWKRDDFRGAVERVITLMEAKGVAMMRPDFAGMSVMIATPCGDGRYERLFVNSLRRTEQALRSLGATVHWVEVPYCSDIAKARNSLLAAFLRGDDTHLFMVDSDMGWSERDVIVLLSAKRDFVAVAGPRKVSPPSFAVRCQNDEGQPVPVRIDPQTGFLEVSEVGAAFVVIARECATRMSQHYADLTYVTADGREEVGVFLPMIVNRQWFSEDFSFCKRWRDIGGRIYVAADLGISHVGANVWHGAWSDQLMQKMADEARVA